MQSITFIRSRLITRRQLLGEPVGAHESDACDEFDAPAMRHFVIKYASPEEKTGHQ
jgi:hypothetical protein